MSPEQIAALAFADARNVMWDHPAKKWERVIVPMLAFCHRGESPADATIRILAKAYLTSLGQPINSGGNDGPAPPPPPDLMKRRAARDTIR